MANKGATGIWFIESPNVTTTLSGASQLLFDKDASRGYLLIENTGSADVGFRFVPANGAASDYPATIGSTGTFTLKAGGSYEAGGGGIPLNAINVIGTAGQPISAVVSSPPV